MTLAILNPVDYLAECRFTSATVAQGGTSRSLLNPAWVVVNLDEVFDRVLEGDDFKVVGVDGVTARDRTLARLDITLRMWFSGYTDRAGANPVGGSIIDQLAANRRDFTTNVVEPSAATDGTRTLTVVEADGTSVSGTIHAEGLQWRGVARGIARATVPVTIKGGKLT